MSTENAKNEEEKGLVGGKYESPEALEEAYKSQDREIQRLQSELSDQSKTIGGLQPVAEFLNQPGALDAVEAYLKNGAPPAEAEVDIYEGLPDDVADMERDQFVGILNKQSAAMQKKFEATAKQMVAEAVKGERSRNQTIDAERSFRERHGGLEEGEVANFKQFANSMSRTDLQDVLYDRYMDSLGQKPGSQARTRSINKNPPNLPQGAGMGAGAPATSKSDDQAFLDMRRSQLAKSTNEALTALKAPANGRLA